MDFSKNRHNHLVIMAGGVGSRLWPISTIEHPKQFVDVLGCGKSLIQLTYDRFDGVVDKENVWVVTSAQYKDIVKEQLPEIPENQILQEPCRRNTAPCIAYVSWKIKKRDSQANILVTPSDHVVLNVPEFQRVVKSGLSFTSESDAIITLGIKPNRPETGYGYIQADLSFSTERNREIYRVDSFKEKPDLETATVYISKNNYFWNSGIFIWKVGTVVNAFRVYQPQLSRMFEDLLPIYDTDEEQKAIDETYPKCENISVDYAILEKADEIYVFPADFGWSDLGTLSSLRLNSTMDIYGNAVVGDHINLVETQNSIIHLQGKQNVIIQGLEGYAVIEKDDNLLICKLTEEQRMKDFWS